MTRPPISNKLRTCCVCGLTREPGQQLGPRDPSILMVATQLYLRRHSKKVFKSCPSVRCCENCLAKAIVQQSSEEARILLEAFLNSLRGGYNAALEASGK